jgi:flagellum-specific ATP synthase
VTLFAAQHSTLERVQPMRVTGSVRAVRGLSILVDDLPLPVGSLVSVRTLEGVKLGEVVGFDTETAIVMLLATTSGVRPGDRVSGEQPAPIVFAGDALLGRCVDALGRPIDNKPAPVDLHATPLSPPPLSPLSRTPIKKPMPTGVRAIDLMTTVGRGQRLGVFAGPGVGKSTIMGSIARRTAADVSVIALIGERGREVRDFIEHSLGEEGLARSVVVCATSDESPLMRIRAALAATSIAEWFRDQGADVMLMMDSVTRFAQAQRQVGLAVGEPPATKGYTPSVFASLPLLLERAGAVDGAGSITAFYAILVEGDDMTEPIADAARGILDGHIILSRRLAQKGHYPAVDVLDSVSRVANEVCDKQHIAARQQLQKLLAAYTEVEDLINIGAYAKGSNPTVDAAIQLKPKIDALLQQPTTEAEPFDASKKRLLQLAVESGALIQQLTNRR